MLTIINNYIEICDRLINKKRCDLLSKKEIEFCKIIKLAKENFRNNNLTSGLRNVRDAVVIHEEMARPMQLYLEKVIPGYNAELEYFNNSNGEKNMNNELIEYCNKIKSQVEQLINNKSLDQANLLIEEYENIIKEDLDIWSMKAVIEIMKNNLDEAEIILKKSLQIDKNSFDINYNLGYLYQLKGNNNVATKYYKIACDITDDNSILQQLNDTINSLSSYDSIENDVKIYIKQGDYSEVINDLNNKVISRDYNKVISVCDYWLENVSKDTAIIYYFKALASNGLREFDDALFYHKKALELDNSFADMRNKKSKYIYDYSEKEINCIGCESNEYEIIWIGNQSISEDNKELINPIRRWVQCKKCGLIYVNPQPEEDVLNKYYSIIAKEKFGGIYGNIDDRFNFLVDLANDRLSKIESYNKGEKTLLDIGAGVGTFVGTALDRGWDATGLELTPEDCEYAKNKYGIEHLQQNFYSFTDNQKYDVVTLFEVIEHLQNPLKDLKRINGLIKQNGLLVVATPIVNTLYGKKMKEHNIFWNVVTHLSYFSREVMIEYLNQSGFEVIETNMSKEQMGRVEFYCRKITEI
ncbi:Ubiquinone biosynthesis O-methyltransferase [bioreactor metagenome]|uniref:Ubiquinone biosynthesis O-methyltransferase n=1 Tax=bioreactor metagenome TaxID=1076179 RepID=A0A644YR66_9ZZZZ